VNLILLQPDDLQNENTALIQDSRRLSHILSILKADIGDTVKVGIKNGYLGTGIILQRSYSKIKLSFSCEQKPPAALPVTLIMAMSRPKSFKKALHYAIAMGVKNIHIIKTWKVDKSYLQSPVLTETELKFESTLALEQCHDTIYPKIEIHRLFKPFAEDIFPKISNNKIKFIAHPYNAQELPKKLTEETILSIGPEGGFIDYEVEMLKSYGSIPITSGLRILRVENAVPAFLGSMFY
jgi:16S rRNA (uracil1498-N3)-methyltransferase